MMRGRPECPTCGQAVASVAGREDGDEFVCDNRECLSNHRFRKCPICGEGPVSVRNRGAGDFLIRCKDGHTWPTIR